MPSPWQEDPESLDGPLERDRPKRRVAPWAIFVVAMGLAPLGFVGVVGYRRWGFVPVCLITGLVLVVAAVMIPLFVRPRHEASP